MIKKEYLRGSAAEIHRQVRTFARLERTHAGFIEFLRETVRPRAGLRVLELACGCGMLADRVRAEFSARAEGWDSHLACIDYATAAYPEVKFLTRDLTEARPRPVFDLLLFREALMEFPSPARVLRRCAGLLRPGGWAAALEPDYGATLIHPVVPGWTAFVDRYAAFCAAEGSEDFFAGRKLIGAFRAAGLRHLATRAFLEVRSALDRPALKEFLEAEIISIRADAPLLTKKKVFTPREISSLLDGLRRVSLAPGAYVQTAMVAVCARR